MVLGSLGGFEMGVKLIAWDIEDTLIPKLEIESNKGRRVVRSNALELIASPPVINLTEGVLPVLQVSKSASIPNGVISSFAYQFGINLLLGSEARDYIDPKLIELGHKHAWEGMILEGRDYDRVLAEFVKPSARMYERLLDSVNLPLQGSIQPAECLYIGDNDIDRETSITAGWDYMDITEIDKVLSLF